LWRKLIGLAFPREQRNPFDFLAVQDLHKSLSGKAALEQFPVSPRALGIRFGKRKVSMARSSSCMSIIWSRSLA